MVEAGKEISIGCDPIEKHWYETWIDEVSNLFYDRGIQITIDESEKQKEAMNKTVMEHAIDCTRIPGQNNNT